MKSMLYVGASLMIGASIYGFVDYKQNREKKEFTGMYTETKHQPVEKQVTKEPEKEIAPVKSTGEAGKKGQVSQKKNEEKEPVIRPVNKEEGLPVSEKKLDESKTEITPKPATTVKKKKKIRREIFSRAPLREGEEEIEPVIVEEKKEAGKN